MMTTEEKCTAFLDWLETQDTSLLPAPPAPLPRLQRFESDPLETPPLTRLIATNQYLDENEYLGFPEPLEMELPELPPPPPLTRATNQTGPRPADDEHENCEHTPCACCVNGILIEIRFIEDGSIPMCDWVKAHRLAHLKKLLTASLYYPLEPPELPKLMRAAETPL